MNPWNKTTHLMVMSGTLAMLGSAGCGKDKAVCDKALATLREGIAAESFEATKEWRGYAYKHCEPAQVAAVDAEFVRAQEAIALRSAEAAALASDTKQLLSLFQNQVAQGRGAPETGFAKVDCGEDGKGLWCTGTRKIQDKPYGIDVAYLRENPKAFRFKTTLLDPFTCDALGANAVARSWKHKQRDRQHCTLGAGPLEGLQALTSNAPGERWVMVFSPEYLEVDKPLQEQLKTEGS